MKLLESHKSKTTKDENVKNISHLETTEVTLVHCNIVKNDHQQDLSIFYILVYNKLFGQLLDFLSKDSIFKKTFNSEFS